MLIADTTQELLLVSRYRCGDTDARAGLASLFFIPLCTCCGRITGNRKLAILVAALTLARLKNSPEVFSDNRALRHFLYTRAVRTSLYFLGARSPFTPQPLPSQQAVFFTPSITPERGGPPADATTIN